MHRHLVSPSAPKTASLLVAGLLAALGAQVSWAQIIPDEFFKRRDRTTVPVLDRPGLYDYQASSIRNADGTIDVWYCGESLTGNGGSFDAIYRAKLSSTWQVLEGPTEVLPPTGDVTDPNGIHACDVSVIRHGEPGVTYTGGIVSDGDEIYYLYYECSTALRAREAGFGYQNPGFNQICVAASLDGITWMDYGLGFGNTDFKLVSTRATPIVSVDPQIADNILLCDNSRTPPGPHCTSSDLATGDFWINMQNGSPNVGWAREPGGPKGYYGTGHPSAVSVDDGTGNREVWLFYFDSKATWNERGIRLRKSQDGIHFGPELSTVLIDPDTGAVRTDAHGNPLPLDRGKVRFIESAGPNLPGFFVAIKTTSRPGSATSFYTYSYDGIHWIESDPPYPPSDEFRLAEARADDQDLDRSLCKAPGGANVVTNAYGAAPSPTGLDILSGEGSFGSKDWQIAAPNPCFDPSEETDRGNTWGFYRVRGDFAHQAPASADVCTLYEGINVRDTARRTAVNPASGEFLYLEGGTVYRYLDEAQFLLLNAADNYLAIDSADYQRIQNECVDGGERICHAYDQQNVRRVSNSAIVWVEDGFRWFYNGWVGNPDAYLTWYPNHNAANPEWTNVDDPFWISLGTSCPSGGWRSAAP